MELTVHRLRFVDWLPYPVTSIAFPPVPPPSPRSPPPPSPARHWFGTLAVGRINGEIELYEWTGAATQSFSPQAWALRKVLPGLQNGKIESLAFSIRQPRRFSLNNPPSLHDLRLFSTGGGTDVLEWDLLAGTIVRSINMNGGSTYALEVNPTSTRLAVACHDGTVRILSIAGSELQMERKLGPAGNDMRMLSVAWGPPVLKTKPSVSSEDDSDDEDEDEAEWDDAWLVSGGSDASIRRWDVRSGTNIARMSVDKDQRSRTKVWAVRVLADGTVVSGDSMGVVKFWDINTSTQFESIKAHRADILCMAIGSDGSSIFTSGIDQTITQCVRLQVTEDDGMIQERWIKTMNKTVHSHDVRALAVWPPYAPFPAARTSKLPFVNPLLSPILVSGGQDMMVYFMACATSSPTILTKRIANPLAPDLRHIHSTAMTFETSRVQRLAYPLDGVVSVAKDARLVVCRRPMELSIWKLRGEDTTPNSALGKPGDFDMVLDMSLNLTTHLIASAISDDGQWLAASDAMEVKLFNLTEMNTGESIQLRPRRIKTISALILQQLSPFLSPSNTPSAAASRLLFTPDSSRLIAVCSPSSHIVVFDLAAPEICAVATFNEHVGAGQGRALKPIPSMATGEKDTQHPPLVTCLSVSYDGQWLASADERGGCHVFNLDTLQRHCTLPSFEVPIRAMTFDPAFPSTLILGQVNNALHAFDVESRTFPEWAKTVFDSPPERTNRLDVNIKSHCMDPKLPLPHQTRRPREKSEKKQKATQSRRKSE
ncbi:U3 small nucleolar RNA-associated protein [Tulasnella sp. 403]|nr:U3 small nucleolar RNA-associated protein [Tulasnella sp. 403]